METICKTSIFFIRFKLDRWKTENLLPRCLGRQKHFYVWKKSCSNNYKTEEVDSDQLCVIYENFERTQKEKREGEKAISSLGAVVWCDVIRLGTIVIMWCPVM